MLDGTSAEDGAELLGSYIKQYYSMRGVAPSLVLISEEIEDMQAVEQFLRSVAGKKVTLTVPQRGRRRELMLMAKKRMLQRKLPVRKPAQSADKNRWSCSAR